MNSIAEAVNILQQGGVIAYPTEHCFGLGCDPKNSKAIERILKIKNRSISQGLILVMANMLQVREYAELETSPLLDDITASWPGPNTWLLPAKNSVTESVRGNHASVAVRISAHPVCQQLSQQFDGAIVSTSANRHGQPALLKADTVLAELGNEVDYIVADDVGGDKTPSQIRNGLTGERIR